MNKKDLLTKRSFEFGAQSYDIHGKPCGMVRVGFLDPDILGLKDVGRYVTISVAGHEVYLVDIDALYTLAWTARDAMPERDDE